LNSIQNSIWQIKLEAEKNKRSKEDTEKDLNNLEKIYNIKLTQYKK